MGKIKIKDMDQRDLRQEIILRLAYAFHIPPEREDLYRAADSILALFEPTFRIETLVLVHFYR
jgi:hypothetical protein